jgi:predicted O-methyltransferase YrrM
LNDRRLKIATKAALKGNERSSSFDFVTTIPYSAMVSSSLKRRMRGVLNRAAALARWPREVVYRWQGRTYYRHRFYESHLAKNIRVAGNSDISDHLNALFFLAASTRPRLIVELGTRGGESTRALLSAAALSDATLLSVDIADCSGLDLPYRERWRFQKVDDIKFGLEGFKPWCAQEGLEPSIDVLFIDTSHQYEHTKEEIRVWSPHLSEDGLMIFHDSNTRNGVYARADGTFGYSDNRGRGVIQAIEEFLGRRYDENAYFTDWVKGFLVLHTPHCNGLTVLKRHSLVGKGALASEAVHAMA